MRIVVALLSLVAFEQTVLAARVCGSPCLEAARLSYRECRRDAAETHVTSRALCRGRDVTCVQACLVGEVNCIAATGLGAALRTCLDEGAADPDEWLQVRTGLRQYERRCEGGR